jgi:hypothetical protein
MSATWTDYENAASEQTRGSIVSQWFHAVIPRAQRAVLGAHAAQTCVELVLGPRGFYLLDFGTVDALYAWAHASTSEAIGDSSELAVKFITEQAFLQGEHEDQSLAPLQTTLKSYDQSNQFVVQMVASSDPHDYFEAFHIPFLAVQSTPEQTPPSAASASAPSSQPAKKSRQQ